MSPQPQTVPLGLAPAGLRGSQLRTVMSSPGSLPDIEASRSQTLPPYAAWVAELR